MNKVEVILSEIDDNINNGLDYFNFRCYVNTRGKASKWVASFSHGDKIKTVDVPAVSGGSIEEVSRDIVDNVLKVVRKHES